MRFGCVIMEHGPVPPPMGPARTVWLRSEGLAELAIYARELQAGLRALPPTTARSISVVPLSSRSDVARKTASVRLRAEWSKTKAAVSAVQLAAATPHIRAAERAAVRAMNFLDDDPLRNQAHIALHRASQLRRGLLGCPIEFRDDGYWTTCAFTLAHIRVGFSPGITGTFACSVCGEAMEDCDHLPGTRLDHVKQVIGEACNICHEATCEHIDGNTYSATVTPLGVSFRSHEVSMVPRPMFPQARLKEIEVTDDLGAMDRVLAKAGTLNCDDCFGPCDGLIDAREWGNRMGIRVP